VSLACWDARGLVARGLSVRHTTPSVMPGSSAAALCRGGRSIASHNGVRFLDELPGVQRNVLNDAAAARK